MADIGWRPRTRIIKAGLQLKLVGTFVGLACASSMFQVVVLNRSMMSLVRQSSDSVDHLLARVPGVLSNNILLTLGTLVPLMVVVGIIITHKIAGPAYAIEKYLREIAVGGRPSRPCTIRAGDELGSLCAAVNAAVSKLTGESADSDSGSQEEPASDGELDEPRSLVAEDEEASKEQRAS